MELKILYEDNHLIAVYKPAGMLVQGDHSGDPTLMDEVKYFIKQRENKPGNVFLGMLHRLDRPVSGIVLFAKTSKGASRLSEQFRNHTIEKIYHTLVIGRPKKEKDCLVHYLEKESEINRVKVHKNLVPNSLKAELEYEAVPINEKKIQDWFGKEVFPLEKYSLLKIKLKTGRSHQIRAQLAEIGCPIVGDIKYGAPIQLKSRRLALCATNLAFTTATTEERKSIFI